MYYTHQYLKDISAGTPLGMCARVTVKYWLSEATTPTDGGTYHGSRRPAILRLGFFD